MNTHQIIAGATNEIRAMIYRMEGRGSRIFWRHVENIVKSAVDKALEPLREQNKIYIAALNSAKDENDSLKAGEREAESAV